MADAKLIDECVHCGFCLPACPTYQSWGRETDSPRGRIYLMKSVASGQSPLTDAVVGHFDQCLGCMACMPACPSGVKYDALIEQTRAEIEHEHRREPADRLFRSLLFALFPHPTRLRVAALGQLAYERSGLRRALHALGLVQRLPPRLRALESLMPPMSLRKLGERLPVFGAAEGPRRARVALLAGCVQRVYFPEVNAATMRVLRAEGCDVLVPPELGCCGALSVHAGREDEAKHLARQAVAALERAEVDVIVTNAAGCGSSMKEWGRLLGGDPAWAERAAAVAAKVRDATEFLAALGPVAPRRPLALKAAYHDACHLAHAQRVRAQPRALLGAIPGVELLEIPDGEQCCGSAGIYNMVQPESAREIGLRKVENLLSAGPELLVSANPGCTLQIQMLLRERGVTLRAAHPLEVIDASIRGDPAALESR